VRAEGLGKVRGMLRLLQFSCEQAGMTGFRRIVVRSAAILRLRRRVKDEKLRRVFGTRKTIYCKMQEMAPNVSCKAAP